MTRIARRDHRVIITRKDIQELRSYLGWTDHDGVLVNINPRAIKQWLEKAEFVLQTGGVRT